MSLALDCVSLFLSKIEIIKIQFKHISTKKSPKISKLQIAIKRINNASCAKYIIS